MRLTCPNCDAKYEVPDDAIPEEGRDVQCSNCGHAWFQMRPDQEAAVEEEAALYGDDLPKPEETAAEPAPVAPPAAVTEPAAAEPEDEDEPQAEAPGGTEAAIAALIAGEESAPAAAAPAPAAPAGQKRELDESVLAVLREEAEREAEARKAEGQRAEAEGQMQVQPDLGVEAVASAALTPTQRRLAMLKGQDPDAPPPEPARPTARRDLLPDVEEINSTLQPADSSQLDAEIDALPDLTKRRNGFRSGFFLMILLLVIAAAVYIAAPKLAEQFPSLRGQLLDYVDFVNGLRVWLNDLMKSATRAIKGGEG